MDAPLSSHDSHGNAAGGAPGQGGGSGLDAQALAREARELRIQLQEAQDTLEAIQNGDVDALIVGADIYTLDTANATTNKLRQDVLAQMADPVLAFDVSEHLVFMNPAAENLYGKSASAALGRPKSEVFEEHWSEDVGHEPAAEVLRKRGGFQAVSVHKTPDGASIHVETRVSVLKDSAGGPMGQLYVVRNISERVAAERALKEADRKKDEFLATLAHELRNPLAPIRNALQIMQLSPSAEIHDNARSIIERQLAHMVRLVDDLLDVSRISQGKVRLRLEQADLANIVRAAVETSRPLIDAVRHELKVLLPPQPLTVYADPTRLAQVIANLLNNAAKYTPPRGSIEVLVAREGAHASVSVKDSGIGIPGAYLPQVFDMFTQVGRSMERSQGGLGIGLALVKRLVEMHGGEVRARSAGAGLGSEFSIRIPLSQALSRKQAVAEEHIESHSVTGIRVLVVDDNVDSAETLAQVLNLVGYQTLTVYDGLAGLRAAETYLPHVAVLDIGLPKLGGHELARRIRQERWGRNMLLIALSGWGHDEDKKKSADAGFDRHFVKPIDLHLLADELAYLRL